MTELLCLGESHKDGNDSGDSSGDDSDFGDMEDGEEGDEGKRRKNASQQMYTYFSHPNRAPEIPDLELHLAEDSTNSTPITLCVRTSAPSEYNQRSRHFL
jgi:hypothetical protein